MQFPVELPADILAIAQRLGVTAADIEEHFTRGGGHGGQKINKTSSVVQLRHVPSGSIVRCQDHREQSANRLSAYILLIRKLDEQADARGKQQAHDAYAEKMRKGRSPGVH